MPAGVEPYDGDRHRRLLAPRAAALAAVRAGIEPGISAGKPGARHGLRNRGVRLQEKERFVCGISGFVHLDGRPFSRDEDLPALRRMADTIDYRGPDDRRYLTFENVGIAFNRLAIVDVENGRQPIETPDGRVSAVVNGELYNHRDLRTTLRDHPLRSASDCEVVPYLYLEYGLDLFDRVNGMFAAVVLDRKERRLLLARDRLGIKPLFYCVVPGGNLLVFGSELKTVLAHPAVPRRLDWLGIMTKDQSFGRPEAPRTSNFLGIEQVPAASVLEFVLDDGSMRRHRYWELPERPDECGERSAEDYAEEYRALLRASVVRRLMADVPYGVFLSGGVDSGLVAALAAEQASFPTFSVASQSTFANGDAGGACETAAGLGLPNHQVLFDLPRLDVGPEQWRQLLWHCELVETGAEQLHKYHLHAFAREHYPDLKVMLLGQGSDEFTGGYIEWLTESAPPWGPAAWQDVRSALTRRLAGTHAFTSGIAMRYGNLVQRGIIEPSFVFEHAGLVAEMDTWRLYHRFWRPNLDLHLWHEDRTSSAHSIENRVPFLDHELLEFLARVPEKHHAALFTDKRIVRMAAAGVVPAGAEQRSKGYFFYGPGEEHTHRMLLAMLRRDSGALLDEAVQGSDLTAGPLHGPGMHTLVAEVERHPSRDNVNLLMMLVNMGLLANMAIDPPTHDPNAWGEALSEIDVGALRERFETAEQVAAPRTERRENVDEWVVDLAPECAFIAVQRGAGAAGAAGDLCLLRNGELIPVSSPSFATFLRALDGRSTVSELIAAASLNGQRVRRQVEEAVTQGFLTTR